MGQLDELEAVHNDLLSKGTKPLSQIDELTGVHNELVSKEGANRGALGEIGVGLKRGAIGELPQQVGQALQWAGDAEGTGLAKKSYDVGTSLAESARARLALPQNQLHPEAHNVVTNNLAAGAEMLAPSIAAPAIVGAGLAATAAAAPSLAVGGAAGLGIASLAGAVPMGMAQAQSSYEAAKEAGASEDVAKSTGWKSGAIETAGEAIGAWAGGKLLGIGGRVLSGAGKEGIAGIIGAATDKAVLKPFGKELVKTALTEVGTEMAQSGGEAFVERQAGVNIDPVEQALAAVGPTLGMTALLAPFGLAGHFKQAKRAESIDTILTDPAAADPAGRTAVVDMLHKEAVGRGLPDADAWHAGALQDITNGLPIRRQVAQDPIVTDMLRAFGRADLADAGPIQDLPYTGPARGREYTEQEQASLAYNQQRNELGQTPASRAGLMGTDTALNNPDLDFIQNRASLENNLVGPDPLTPVTAETSVLATQQELTPEQRRAERAGELQDVFGGKSILSAEAEQRLSLLERQMDGGEQGSRWQQPETVNTEGQTEPGVWDGVKSTNPEWLKKGGALYGASKGQIRSLIEKVRTGAELTPNQADLWFKVQQTADTEYENDPVTRAGKAAEQIQSEHGIELDTPKMTPANSVFIGDKVVLAGNDGVPSLYEHKGFDTTGNIIFSGPDGEQNVRPDDNIPIMGTKARYEAGLEERAALSQSYGTNDQAVTPKPGKVDSGPLVEYANTQTLRQQAPGSAPAMVAPAADSVSQMAKNETQTPLSVPGEAQNLIFGKTWEEFQAMQQGKQQSHAVKPGPKPVATQSDIRLLKDHGLEGLQKKKFDGVIDRLRTSGIVPADVTNVTDQQSNNLDKTAVENAVIRRIRAEIDKKAPEPGRQRELVSEIESTDVAIDDHLKGVERAQGVEIDRGAIREAIIGSQDIPAFDIKTQPTAAPSILKPLTNKNTNATDTQLNQSVTLDKTDDTFDPLALLQEGKKAEAPAPSRASQTKPAAPSVDTTVPGFGANNKIFTADAAAKARALLKSKLGRLNSGIDPELMQAGITLAGHYIEGGARKFIDYAHAMINDLGKGIIPYLRSFYEAVRWNPGVDNTQMSTPEEIENVLKLYAAENLESDSQGTGTQNDLGKNSVPDGSSGADQSNRSGPPESEKEGGDRSGGENVLSGSETTPSGKRGDISPYSTDRGPATEDGPAGSDNDQRGGDTGVEGTPPEHIPTATVEQTASSRSERLAAQRDAESIKAVPGDRDNIAKTLPVLYGPQQDDVLFAEERFTKPTGYGVMFTNGTGTGKTFSAAGIIKRFVKQGKTNILILAPDNVIIEDAWVPTLQVFGLRAHRLADTKDAGKGISITTYANFGTNDDLAKRKWDLIVSDECHQLEMNEKGESTKALEAFRAVSMHPRGAITRTHMLHRDLVNQIADLHARAKELRKDDPSPGQLRQADNLEKQAGILARVLDGKRKEIEKDIAANQGEKRTRAVLLSATPFAYEKNVDYAEGLLFDYPAIPDGSGGYNSGGGFERFMMQHFGYSMRYNKLTQPDADVNSGLMQRQFNSWLKKEKVLSSRKLDVPFDYDRRFVLVESQIGQKIDEGMEYLWEEKRFRSLGEIMRKRFNYLEQRYLLEAIKAKEVIPIINKHLEMGRRVVVFHDYIKGGGLHPFDFSGLRNSREEVYNPETEEMEELGDIVKAFEQARPDLVNLPILGLQSPINAFKAAFPDLLVVNGQTVTKKEVQNNVEKFGAKNTGPAVILVQSDKDKGWSGHDTTGDNQRVLINLGLPTRPTRAIQQEGRIYRVGQASNAIFRYLNTGTNWERWAFASTIAKRASTAENLAMGEEARSLLDSFINEFEASDLYPPGHDGEGTGGKEQDASTNNILSEWDRATALYYSNQKKNSRTKAQEGADYFATPEPVGLKMVEWADIRPGEKILEPSAGHGAIARFFPENTDNTYIEPSNVLGSRLKMVTEGRLIQDQFENLDAVNKFDAIVMNPPFGTAGKTAMDHIEKAVTHLRDGGRIVALVPAGPAMDKRVEKFLYGTNDKGKLLHPELQLVAVYEMPSVLFERAGTKVMSKILVIDKHTDKELAARVQQVGTRTFTDETEIKDLFARIENSAVPDRVPMPVKAQAAGKTPVATTTTAAEGDTPVEHTTQKGKLLKGVIRTGITKEEAKEIDPYTFKKGDGYFIREKYISTGEATVSYEVQEPTTNSTAGPGRRRGAVSDRQTTIFTAIDAAKTEKTFLESQNVQIGTFAHDLEKVTTPEDVAHVLAPLARQSQEVFMVLALNSKGKPISVLRHTTGGPVSNHVFMGQLLGSIHNTDGAASVWFAHNHPSGALQHSPQDVALQKAIYNGLQGTGVQVKGHIILGAGGGGSVLNHEGSPLGSFETKEPGTTKAVPVTERQLIGGAHELIQDDPISDSTGAAKILDTFQEPSGVLFLDSQSRPVRFYPLNEPEMLSLREGGKTGVAASLYRLLDKKNGLVSALLKLDRNNRTSDSVLARRNIVAFLNQAGIKLLDVIEDGKSNGSANDLRQTAAAHGNVFLSMTVPAGKRADIGKELGASLGAVYFQRILGKTLNMIDTQEAAREMIKSKLSGIKYSKDGAIQGFTVDGQIYMVKDGIATGQALPVFLHEVAHLTRLGFKQDTKYQAILDGIKDLPEYRAAMARVPEGTNPDDIAEEALAYMIENNRNDVGLVRRFIAMIKQALIKLGVNANILNADDLKALAVSVARGLETTPGAGAKLSTADRAMKAVDTASAEFKKWFGDSRVVDGSGAPLRVYHTSTYGDVSEFNKDEQSKGMAGYGFYFSDVKGADIYAKHSVDSKFDRSWNGAPKRTNITPVFLQMQSPLISDNISDVAEQFGRKDPGQFGQGRKYVGFDKGLLTTIQRAGYDGVISNEYVKRMRDGSLKVVTPETRGAIKHPVYVVFEPAQIKSAISNTGDFSPTDKRIQYSKAATHFGGITAKQAASLERLGGIAKPVTVKEWWSGYKVDLGKKFQQYWADQYAALKSLDPKAYMLARMSAGQDGALEAMLNFGDLFLEDGITDVTVGKKRGVIEAFQELQGEQHRFLWWIAANRAEKLTEEERENLFQAEDIAELKKLNTGNMVGGEARSAVYDRVLKDYIRANKNVMDIAEKSELIDSETRSQWEHDMYVPFYRVREEQAAVSGPKAHGGLVRQHAFKQLKGGTRKLNQDLLANVMMNWSHVLSASAKNRAAKASLDAAVKVDVAEYVGESPKQGKTDVYYMGRFNKILPAGQKYTEEGETKISDGTKEVSVWGKKYYRVDDPLVLASLNALEFAGFGGTAMGVVTKFKRALTTGVTANPAFKIRNLIRDSMTTPALTGASYNPIGNVYQGVKAMSAKGQTYASLLASGGLIRFGSMIEGDSARHVDKLINSGVKASSILDTKEKALDFLTKAVDWYNETGDISEGANRAALYEQLRAKGMSHAEASYQARDVMDFHLHGAGSAARFLMQTVPFFNARVQGLYKLARAGKADPKRLGAVLGATAMASIALMLGYKDDDDWKAREDWDRDTYFWFKLGGTAWRIPKGFEVGVIATLAERSLEYFISDEMTGKRLGARYLAAFSQTLAFNPVPQIIKPLIDLYADTDSFTGRPIEGAELEGRLKSDRIKPRTSELAKLIGGAGDYTGISPVQVDHLIRGYLGWVGSVATVALDTMARPALDRPERPDMKLRDVFLAGNFVETLPSGSSRYVTAFYNQAKEVQQAYQSAKADKDVPADLHAKYTRANRTQKQLGSINKQIRIIEANETMGGAAKRRQLDVLTARKNNLAKQYVDRSR